MPSSKKSKPVVEEKQTSTELCNWLRALVEFIGNGGLTYAAGCVSMTPSGLLKLLNRNGFHEPTLRCVALLLESRSELYPDAEIVRSQRVGNYVFEEKKVGENIMPTWRKLHTDEV